MIDLLPVATTGLARTNEHRYIATGTFSDKAEERGRSVFVQTMKSCSLIRSPMNRSFARKPQHIGATTTPRLLRLLTLASFVALCFSGAQANTTSPGPALRNAASTTAAPPTTSGANPAFVTGSRVANSGGGFSTYATLAPKTFRVECNCADFSLDTRICTSTSYQCHCTPRAALTCQ